jgi:putative transposase
MLFHVVVRANRRECIFPQDYERYDFLRALEIACLAVSMRVVAWCLMPNHVHLVVWTRKPGDLGRFVHRLLSIHVRRHHARLGTSGRIWQGRFKSFPIKDDAHLLTVLRYVERNPVRARLTDRAEDWRWSSARWWLPNATRPSWADPGPVARPEPWLAHVNTPQTAAELQAVRRSVQRGTPWGDPAWAQAAAQRLRLLPTLRRRGRPRGAAGPAARERGRSRPSEAGTPPASRGDGGTTA